MKSGAPAESLLLASAGNTRLALAHWDGAAFGWRGHVGNDALGDWRETPSLSPAPEAVLWAGVRPASEAAIRALAERLGAPAVAVDREALALGNATRQPERVGIDRLLVARAALARARREWLVIDAGTAITCDRVSADGSFLGGAIAPGLTTAAQALGARGALLPEVRPAAQPRAIGRDTDEAIGAGLYWGFRGLVAELVRQQRAEGGGSPAALVTGGDGALLLPAISGGQLAPDLLLEGMLAAWRDQRGAA